MGSHPGCRWVHSGAHYGFVGVRWVHLGPHLGSSGSVGFIQALRLGPWVRSGWLGSFIRGMVVVRFIWVRCVKSGAPLCSLGSLRRVVGFIRVQSGASRMLSGSFWLAGYIRALLGGRRVHSVLFSSLGRVRGVVGFNRACHEGLVGWFRLFGVALAVVVIFQVCWVLARPAG